MEKKTKSQITYKELMTPPPDSPDGYPQRIYEYLGDKSALENFGVDRTEVISASSLKAWTDIPSLSNLFDISNYHGHNPDLLFLKAEHDAKPENRKLTADEFAAEYAECGLEYDPNFTPRIIEEIVAKKKLLDDCDEIISYGKGGFLETAGSFGAELVVTNIAPVNLAINLGTAVVPGGAVARSAWWAANPVKSNMVKMAAGGAAGQALLEPFIHKERDLEQREYSIGNSVVNIAGSAAFSSALPLAFERLKYGFGRFKYSFENLRKNYFATPESLNESVASDSPALDAQMRANLERLASETAPNTYDSCDLSVQELQQLKKTVRDRGLSEFPEFFQMEDKIAAFEDKLHKEFATSGNIDAVPDGLQDKLHAFRLELAELYNKYSDNVGFNKITEELKQLDQQMIGKLRSEQSALSAYDLDQRDLYIARNQLEQDKFIDLDDPANAKSIFDDEYRLHDKSDIEVQTEQLAQDLLDNAKTSDFKQHVQEHENVDEQVETILKGIKNDLDEPTIDSLIHSLADAGLQQQITNLHQQYKKASPLGSDRADLLNEFSAYFKEGMILSLRDKALTAQNLQKAEEYIARFTHLPSEGFKDFLRQVELRQITVSRQLGNGLLNDLINSDLLHYFNNNKFAADIARELFNLTAKNKTPTKSNIAKDIASIVHKWQTSAINRANNAGANINELASYITRQSHSSWKIKQAGYNKWRGFIEPLLDSNAMDKNVDLHQVYLNLATNKHLQQNDKFLSVGLRSGMDITKYFASARRLHFKSADSWLKYNEQFGTHNLAHSIAINLDRLGSNIGILETMDSDPRTFLDNLRNKFNGKLQEKAASGDRLAQKEMDFLSKKKLDNILDIIISDTVPENPKLSTIMQGWRNLKTMSSLGQVLLTSISDFGTIIGEQLNHGIPLYKSIYNALKGVTHSFSSKEKKEFARLLGVGTENLLGQAYSRLNLEHQTVYGLTKLSNYYFKLNLMDWWDNSFKSTMGLVFSNNLAHHVKSPYSKAPAELKLLLERYGINKSNWSLYKRFIKKATDGREYIMPSEYTGNDAKMLEAGNNFRNYLLDRVDTSIITPHALERHMGTFGTKTGTVIGEIVRHFMQFKHFTLSYMSRSLKDYTTGQLSPHERRGGLSDIGRGFAQNPQILVATTSFVTAGGYLAIIAKDLVKGNDVPEPTKETLERAFLQGGGAGFLGDFILGNHNRYGHNLLQEAAGPGISDLADIAAMSSDVKEGKSDEAGKKLKSLTCRNTPYRNLFYLYPALRAAGVNQQWVDQYLNCRNTKY